VIPIVPVFLAILLQIPQPSRPPSPARREPAYGKRSDTREVNKGAQSNSQPPKTPSTSPLSESPYRDLISQDFSNYSHDRTAKDWWTIILTGMLVIVGGLQVYVYWRQADYMRRGLRLSIRQTRLAARNAAAAQVAAAAAKTSAKIAKDALELTQRAFVQVTSMGLNRGNIPLANNMPVTDDASVVVNFKNHGPTRAINVTVKGTLSITPGNKSTILAPPVSYDLPSATDVAIAFDPFNSWLDADAIALIKQGMTVLQVSLKLTYTDIFGISHETEIEAALRDWMQRRWDSKLNST
jgi:hypothetical protein